MDMSRIENSRLTEQEQRSLLNAILGSLTDKAIDTIIKAKRKDIEEQIDNHPKIYHANGSPHVSWKCDGEDDKDKCYEADRLIWERNVWAGIDMYKIPKE